MAQRTYGGGYVAGTGSSRNGNRTLYLFSLVVLFPLMLVGMLFVNRMYQRKRQEQFLREVEIAKSAVLRDITATKQVLSDSSAFVSGKFTASYNNNLRGSGTYSAQGIIHFGTVKDIDDVEGMKSQHTRSITGKGTNEDGGFEIAEGKLSIVSGTCYWIQEEAEGDVNADDAVKKSQRPRYSACRCPWSHPKHQVLVTGNFGTAKAGSSLTFQGRWFSTTGASGTFTDFRAQPK
jgi:hypothetical protein